MWICTGDVHIHDHAQFSNFLGIDGFRLKQYLDLADWMTEVFDRRHGTAFIIAGDLLHVCSPAPEVVLTAHAFLKKLLAKGDVYITQGQHDIAARKVVDSFKSRTLIALFQDLNEGSPHAIHFLHEETAVIDGRQVYFKGWQPSYDLSCPPGTEVFVGHTTLNQSQVGATDRYDFRMEGTDTANTFQLGFFGDIHRHQVLGNCIVPGVPIQASFGDHPDCGLIVIDPKTLGWQRELQPKGRFLRFITDHTETELIDEVNRVVYQAKSYGSKMTSAVVKAASVDPLQVIETLVETDVEMRDYHRQVLGRTYVEHYQLDFDFTPIAFRAVNYRGIDFLDLNFADLSVLNLIVGANGQGKSTLIRGIKEALTGMDGRKASFDGEPVEIEIRLAYDGQEYSITRSWAKGKGAVTFAINGVEQDEKSIDANKRLIGEHLPWLDSFDLIYLPQNRQSFLAAYNVDRRINILSEILNLSIFKRLEETASADLKTLTKALQTTATTLSVKRNAYETALTEIGKLSAQEGAADEDACKAQIMALADEQSALNAALNAYVREQAALQSTVTVEQQAMQRTLRDLSDVNQKIHHAKSNQCYACGQTLQDDELLKALEAELDDTKTRLETTVGQLNAAKAQLAALAKPDHGERLKAIGQEILTLTGQLSNSKLYEKYRNDIATLNGEIAALDATHDQLTQQAACIGRYLAVVGFKGQGMGQLLEQIAALLSTEDFQICTLKNRLNGNVQPDFNVQYRVRGHWVDYDDLSGGQRCLVDVYILDKLLSLTGKPVGLLIFDEFFSPADRESLDRAVAIMDSMRLRHNLIVTHENNFPRHDALIKVEWFKYLII